MMKKITEKTVTIQKTVTIHFTNICRVYPMCQYCAYRGEQRRRGPALKGLII